MTAIAIDPVRETGTAVNRVPLLRLVNVELRKMFDTRSGFWLMASIVITALLMPIGLLAGPRGRFGDVQPQRPRWGCRGRLGRLLARHDSLLAVAARGPRESKEHSRNSAADHRP